ncbi:MAG: substrate-binding domain-containing protein [Oscillospiraceae bacterium]|jgi:ABC-type sugar transport system substrate-binding protein|nr:substrate-binding domain-containing protein [Oscillospiraceae bacterium]
MKKTISLILAIAMLLALGAACAKKDEPAAPTPTPAAPATATPDAPPPAPATPDAPATEAPPAPPADTGTIGYVTDKVDHQAREKYNIVYYNYQPSNGANQTYESLQKLGDVYNFSVEYLTANSDPDAYVNNIQTILLKEPDGLIVDITQELAARVGEIIEEYDIPTIVVFNNAMDADGHEIIPGVIMDQKVNGQTQVQYLADTYKTYWPDAKPEEIALLVLDFSANMDLNARAVAAEGRFKELFPGNAYYYGDIASEGWSVEAGYNVANSILSAHPEVKYWFISGTAEDPALGGSRAVQALKKEDSVLIVSSGSALLTAEWDSGYDGPWKANYAAPPFLYAATATFGLLALIDGRATNETLWADQFLPGDFAARFVLKPEMMTRDNYVEYIGNIMKSFGVQP